MVGRLNRDGRGWFQPRDSPVLDSGGIPAGVVRRVLAGLRQSPIDRAMKLLVAGAQLAAKLRGPTLRW